MDMYIKTENRTKKTCRVAMQTPFNKTKEGTPQKRIMCFSFLVSVIEEFASSLNRRAKQIA
jgi:hypothetical protein